MAKFVRISSVTGRFVTREFAEANPATTVRLRCTELPEKPPPGRRGAYGSYKRRKH